MSTPLPKSDKIYVAGHSGLVGSAVVRALRAAGHDNIVFRTSAELDLTDQGAVRDFFDHELPDRVILAAAKVGGIHANNTYPAEFIYSNLVIQTNIIDTAYRRGVKRLIFLGSSCIYPRLCPQPMLEEYLLTGTLEPTNEPYAVAKIAGIKMCESYNRQYNTDFMPVMPTNLYGINDNLDLETSHVLPALLRKVHEAKITGSDQLTIWGSGTPKREFLHVDDLASAIVLLSGMDGYRETVNIGCGVEITIRELAQTLCDVIGFKGTLVFDRSKPDGAPRKLLDITRITRLGWKPRIALREGLEKTYAWFLQQSTDPALPRRVLT